MKAQNRDQLNKIYQLISYLKNNPYKNLQQIMATLEFKDLPVSERSFYRLKRSLSTDFGIEIVFDHYKNGYYLDEQNSINIHSFYELIQLMTFTNLLDHQILKHLCFDEN